LHATHAPVQAESQQRPSMQRLDMQALATVQALPFESG